MSLSLSFELPPAHGCCPEHDLNVGGFSPESTVFGTFCRLLDARSSSKDLGLAGEVKRTHVREGDLAASQSNHDGATTGERKRREAAAVLGNRGRWSGDQRRRRKKRGRAGEVNAQDPAMAVVLAVMAVEGEGGEAAGDVEEKGRWRRSAAMMVEETGSTEARKAGGRRREQRLSRVASGERVEEVEYEAGGELRWRRNRERRRWQRGRRNRVMGDDFPNSSDGKAERKKPWKRENVAATAREGRKEEVRSRGWRWIPTGGNAAAGDHTARWGRRDRGGRRRRAAVQRSWTATAAWSLAFKAQAKIVSIRPNKE